MRVCWRWWRTRRRFIRCDASAGREPEPVQQLHGHAHFEQAPDGRERVLLDHGRRMRVHGSASKEIWADRSIVAPTDNLPCAYAWGRFSDPLAQITVRVSLTVQASLAQFFQRLFRHQLSRPHGRLTFANGHCSRWSRALVRQELGMFATTQYQQATPVPSCGAGSAT